MQRIATVLSALTAGAAALAGPSGAGAQAPPPATPQQLAERFFTGTAPLRGLRVSRAGTRLRIALPWAVATDRMRADLPFRWQLTAELVRQPGRSASAWVDDVPDSVGIGDPGHPNMVLHRP